MYDINEQFNQAVSPRLQQAIGDAEVFGIDCYLDGQPLVLGYLQLHPDLSTTLESSFDDVQMTFIEVQIGVDGVHKLSAEICPFQDTASQDQLPFLCCTSEIEFTMKTTGAEIQSLAVNKIEAFFYNGHVYLSEGSLNQTVSAELKKITFDAPAAHESEKCISGGKTIFEHRLSITQGIGESDFNHDEYLNYLNLLFMSEGVKEQITDHITNKYMKKTEAVKKAVLDHF